MNAQTTISSRLLRLSQILAPNGPVPVSRSSWWSGVKSGRFPAPIKLGPRTTAWRSEDIERLLRNGVYCGDGQQTVESAAQNAG